MDLSAKARAGDHGESEISRERQISDCDPCETFFRWVDMFFDGMWLWSALIRQIRLCWFTLESLDALTSLEAIRGVVMHVLKR